MSGSSGPGRRPAFGRVTDPVDLHARGSDHESAGTRAVWRDRVLPRRSRRPGGWPTAYLIDHRGLIVRKVSLTREDGELIEAKVKEVEAAARK